MAKPSRVEPGPRQESVWDYPRPPRVEPSTRRVVVTFGGRTVAETSRSVRVLETSHPPTYYIPIADVVAEYLRPSARSSFCEWKGRARYWTLAVGDALSRDAAWSYPDPSPAFATIRDHLAFYAIRVDRCEVDGRVVEVQPGDFYGGWITPDVVGPFKGGAGTMGW